MSELVNSTKSPMQQPEPEVILEMLISEQDIPLVEYPVGGTDSNLVIFLQIYILQFLQQPEYRLSLFQCNFLQNLNPIIFSETIFLEIFETVHRFFMEAFQDGFGFYDHYNVFIDNLLSNVAFPDYIDTIVTGIHFMNVHNLNQLSISVNNEIETGNHRLVELLLNFFPIIPVHNPFFISILNQQCGGAKTRTLILEHLDIIENSVFLENALDFVMEELRQQIQLSLYVEKLLTYINQLEFPIKVFYLIIDDQSINLYNYIDFISQLLHEATLDYIGPINGHNFEGLFNLYNHESVSIVYFTYFVKFLNKKLDEQVENEVISELIGIIRVKLESMREQEECIDILLQRFE